MTGKLHRIFVLAALALAPAAQAQTFPDKPVRVVVPFPPGGLVDTFARTLQRGHPLGSLRLTRSGDEE